MANLKRLFSLTMVLIMIFSLSACSRRQTSSGYWVGSDYTDDADVTDQNQNDDTQSTISDGNGASSTDKGTSSGSTSSSNKGTNRNDDIWQINRNVKPEAKKSVKGTNFGGKTFRMLVWQENYSAQDKKNIAAFEKAYNCKVSVDQVNFEDYLTVMATALSSGKPYDIVKTHAAFFPQAAISNLYQPMQKYISSSDIVSASNKKGIDWNKTVLNATWGNNVYYVMDQRGCQLPVMLYNKLLFEDYGLEDAMSLYKKGKWTWDKIREYAKVVSSSGQGVYFFDDTVSDQYTVNDTDFYTIQENGKIKWNGANTKFYTDYAERRKLRELSPLSGETALVDNLTSGKAMLQVIEAEKLPVFATSFKGSSAFGKDLNNVGVVPIPMVVNNSRYSNGAITGYAACRGADPSVAVAFTILISEQVAPWANSGIPAIDKEISTFDSLYSKMKLSGSYYFLSSSGERISEVIYPMYGEIDKGGDIMKLLESYSSKVKTVVEYNLSQQ